MLKFLYSASITFLSGGPDSNCLITFPPLSSQIYISILQHFAQNAKRASFNRRKSNVWAINLVAGSRHLIKNFAFFPHLVRDFLWAVGSVLALHPKSNGGHCPRSFRPHKSHWGTLSGTFLQIMDAIFRRDHLSLRQSI